MCKTLNPRDSCAFQTLPFSLKGAATLLLTSQLTYLPSLSQTLHFIRLQLLLLSSHVPFRYQSRFQGSVCSIHRILSFGFCSCIQILFWLISSSMLFLQDRQQQHSSGEIRNIDLRKNPCLCFSLYLHVRFVCVVQIGSRLNWSRNYAAKDIRFGVEARASMLKGVEDLADAVKVTMGPKVIFPNHGMHSLNPFVSLMFGIANVCFEFDIKLTFFFFCFFECVQFSFEV